MAHHLNPPFWAAVALAATVILATVPAVKAAARVELFTTDGTTSISERVLDAICDDVPANTVAIEIVMGLVRDQFKPVAGTSICDMLKANDRHQWFDGNAWVVPAYHRRGSFPTTQNLPDSQLHCGGSAPGWLAARGGADRRAYLSFWAGAPQAHAGGCCTLHPATTAHEGWSKAFVMNAMVETSAPTTAPPATTAPTTQTTTTTHTTHTAFDEVHRTLDRLLQITTDLESAVAGVTRRLTVLEGHEGANSAARQAIAEIRGQREAVAAALATAPELAGDSMTQPAGAARIEHLASGDIGITTGRTGSVTMDTGTCGFVDTCDLKNALISVLAAVGHLQVVP